MKERLKNQALFVLADLAVLGCYWICESFWVKWLYAMAPVAITVGAVTILAFLAGLITKKSWLVFAFPTVTTVAIAALAVATKWLSSLSAF